MQYYEQCPFCASHVLFKVLSVRDRLVSHDSFAILRCGSCGLLFTDPSPTPAEISAYYASEEYVPLSSETDPRWTSRLIRMLRHWIVIPHRRRLIEHESGERRGSILDIGCGNGELLAALRDAGWQARGIEPDARGRMHAHQRGLHADPLEVLPELLSGSFDVVTLWHSLEHVHDVGAMLREVHRLLRPSGVCIIALPNADCPEASVYGADWFAWDVPRHLWHFTPHTINAWAERAGFRMRSMRGLILDGLYTCLLSDKSWGESFLHGLGVWLRSTFREPHNPAIIFCVFTIHEPAGS